MGWKVQILTKNELCMPQQWNLACIKFNLSWYTYCIVTFLINPHLISTSGLCSTRDISTRPGKLTKGVLLHQDNAPARKSVVSMAAVCDCGFELVDHPLQSTFSWFDTIWLFSVPNMKNAWLGSSIGPIIRSHLQLRTFSRIRIRASNYITGNQAQQHGWKKCVDSRGDHVEHTWLTY